eukprot:2777803-Rhodomonas_salina.3
MVGVQHQGPAPGTERVAERAIPAVPPQSLPAPCAQPGPSAAAVQTRPTHAIWVKAHSGMELKEGADIQA